MQPMPMCLTFSRGEEMPTTSVRSVILLPIPYNFKIAEKAKHLLHLIDKWHHVIWLIGGLLLLAALIVSFFELPAIAFKFMSAFLALFYVLAWVLRYVRPHDVLGYQHGISFSYQKANTDNTEQIFQIADAWFGSERLGGPEGRKSYFKKWLINSRQPTLYILNEHASDGSIYVVGYTSIMMLDPEVYEKHRHRKELSQYDFTVDNLCQSNGKLNKWIYVQAIALHPARFYSLQARVAIKNMVAVHLADILGHTGVKPDATNICLYGEKFSSGGEKYVKSLGGIEVRNILSKDEHPFLETELPRDVPAANSLRQAINDSFLNQQGRNHGILA